MKTPQFSVITLLFSGMLILFCQTATCAQTGKARSLDFAGSRPVRSPNGILSNGWLLQSVVKQDKADSTTWMLESMSSFSYGFDAYGNKTRTLQQISINGGWANNSLDSATFDAVGRPITHLNLSWQNGAWVPTGFDTLTYDANGYKTSTLAKTWNGSAFVNSKYDTYTNDASGNPTIDVSQTWSGSGWVNFERFTFTYNANEQHSKIQQENWNDGAWDLYGQELITYGTNAKRSNVLLQAWRGGEFVNYTQDNYTDDANGNEILDVYQTWKNGEWQNLDQWISTYDSYGNVTDYLLQDWFSNTWRDQEWWQYTWIQASPLLLLRPAKGEVILAGSKYTIEWHGVTVNLVDIDLSLDGGATFTTVANGVSGAQNSHIWQTPDTLSAKCIIRVRAHSDATKNGQSGQFRIKPYVLTRLKANGDYELYDPAIHGWQFKNSGSVMWPQSWWQQLSYYHRPDPITGQDYTWGFFDFARGVLDSNFVDWPLFVRLFGSDVCYKSVPRAVYSPLAVQLWSFYRDSSFQGSCFGFAAGSVLAFEHPAELLQRFPEIGTFQNLRDLPPDTLCRRAINELYETQFGFPTWQTWVSLWKSHDPRATLEELKDMLLSDASTHRTLGIGIPSGGHALAPYRLERDNVNHTWNLFVYDCNCPTSDCHGVVVIDSLSNSWSYPPLGWSRSGTGLCLAPDPLNLLATPGLWTVAGPSSNIHVAPLSAQRVQTSSYARLFNSDASITITNATGQSTGFRDGTSFNELSDGMPIIPMTGMPHRPLGYWVPSGTYAVRMYAFANSTASFSACESSRIFICSRAGAGRSETDLLSYDNGLAFGNPDMQTKSVNLECITTVGSAERVFKIQNCPALHNDSLSIAAPDVDRLTFVNYGPQKTYGLNLESADENGLTRFSHASITMPANSSHIIVPVWPNLVDHPVQIYEDIGITGVIRDTLTLTNQVNSVEQPIAPGIAQGFRLEQNYPNPFNAETGIRFSVPTQSGRDLVSTSGRDGQMSGVSEAGTGGQGISVKLAVYDILGREVAVLVNERKASGTYEVRFSASGGDGRNLASGVYLYRLTAGNFVQSRKMIVLR